ncbi:uncharacterized protein FOMMEDRAFT_18547 [Fomitiporia mediterranea MF3/22]|uniref:uncharacterized protein n=1 Tax=Fomitiporia mediterranea (strain MF3/22) TaxID=694068 RepID=UPI00044089DC|nr:uncharacterized protein FOMMEDRAFT_18547 [Fomitiporia mediterranea MF3/22]EJD04822.1 hypothetical protein FOMMEDRAFT_18547 [Fomitiporia mediterranea MF3/22]
MAQVYEVPDDDVELVDHPPASSSDEKNDDSGKDQSSQGSASPTHPSSPLSTHSNANNSIKNDVMHVDGGEVTATTGDEPSRSRGRGAGEDVKMEETGSETGLEDEKNELMTRLPILDNSAALLPPPPPPDSNANGVSSSSSAAGDVKRRPSSSPSLNGDAAPAAAVPGAAAADEKSKKPASTAVKAKSAKRRSPSHEPPPPPPRRAETIRLEISLGGPENYAVDILQLSKDTGQRPPTPPPPSKQDTSESEGEGGDDESRRDVGIGKGKGRGKAGRKSAAAEYYDLNDPFIDDSELALDERTYFAQTKQTGFYVSSGEVALLKDKSRDKESRERGTSPARKPRSKRNIVPTIIPLAGTQAVNAAVTSSTGLSTVSAPPPSKSATTSPIEPSTAHLSVPGGQGTRETPITLSDTEDNKPSISTVHPLDTSISISANGIASPTDGDGGIGGGPSAALKRKASETTPSGKKKRKTIDIDSFHPDLQTSLYELKDAITRESFDQKGKFPPSLKPVLARVALKAIHVGEYNDMFFALMPKLFIYNKYTMTKLIKRTVYPEHKKLLEARQDELVEELGKLAQEGFEKAKEEYEKSVSAWERRQERTKAGGTSLEGTPVPGAGTSTPSMNGGTLPPPGTDTGADSGMEVDGAPPPTQGGEKEQDGEKEQGEKERVHSSQHMPIQRFRLTERMRNIIWELVWLSNEGVRIENEKNTLENSTVQVSEQGARKVLYQKIVSAFPDGWMSSGQISREVSVMKKRYEAQQAEGIS